MADANSNPRTTRSTVVQAVLGLSLLMLVVVAAWYLTSGRFRDFVRGRLVAQLEQMTGGRVELKTLRWNLSALEVEATDITIHGLESPDELPYAHADRLYARLKIISLLRKEAGLRQITINRPVVHIIVYPDGTTNQPTPKVKQQSNRDPVQLLFDLAIERAEVQEGMLIWNHRRIPMDFTASDLRAGMTYEADAKRYDGSIHIGKIDTKLQDYRPFSSLAEVQFSVFPNRAEVKGLKWSSGQTQLEAHGSISDFRAPRIELVYNVSANLAEAASIARVRELRAGTLNVQGQGSYSLQGFSSNGKLQIKTLEYSDGNVHLRDAYAGSEFSLDQDRLSLSHVFARVFGGTVTGEANVRNWMTTPPPDIAKARGMAKNPPQQGSATFNIHSIPVQQIAEALSSREVPLDRLNLVGATGGTVVARWTGSASDTQASIALDVTPPAFVPPEQLPVTANIRGAYSARSQALDLSEMNLVTRATRLSATGSLGRTRANLRFAIDSSNVGEFKPLIDAVRGPEPLPVDIAGVLAFNGTMSGRLTAPSLAGHLELQDFTTVYTPAPTQPSQGVAENSQLANAAATIPVLGSQPVQRRIHWDRLSADVQYSQIQASVSHGTLRRGNAQVKIDASATLTQGSFTDASPFTARLNVTNAEVAELQSIAGYDYPITGMLDANVQVSGTKNNTHGSGRFALTDAVAYGQPIRSLNSDIVFGGQEAQLRNIVLESDVGRVRGGAAYNTKSEVFRFDLHGADLRMAQVKQLQKKLQVDGLLNVDASGSGTLKEPVLNARLRMRNLVVNGEKLGDLNADAKTQGMEMLVSARSNFQNANLTMDGNVHLRGDMPGHLVVRFGSLNVNPLLKSFVTGSVTGRSSMAGNIVVDGPLKQPKLLSAIATIDQFSAEVENVRVQSARPLRFVMANQVIRVESFRLEGEEAHFINAGGTAELGGARRLNLRLDGKVNMKLLQSFGPDLMAYGTSEFGVTVGGTINRPALQGQVQISNGGISYIDLPNGLSDINGTMVFTQNRLHVQQLTARSGGGMLNIGGFITFDRAFTFNLSASGKDIRLRYPPGISATADADLMLAGTIKNSLLSGDVTITKFGLNPRFDFALYLASSKQAPQTPKPDSPLNNLRFDVHVISTPELQVQTSLAKVSGDVDLRLRGTGTHPTVLGRVNIVEGDVFFNATKYHLERGDITFTNPVRIEPVLDVEASARVRDYEISLGFHGSVDKLSTTYRSDPPLPTGDIIALLALGRTREESATAQMYNPQQLPNMTETASNALLGQALNATVSSRVQKLFGVSRIKIDPQVGGPENNPNARLTIEQQVSNKITLTYITNLSQSAQQIIQMEYNLNRNVSILAVRDQNGVLGFDIRVRQRKK
ncbi:MAG TPA: translocation/assembly module TamB domain-containing protein [Clostridia bacterium]|nr:translocation/assembly module TamB domain-containing protein [Clostridia bacterium]